MSAGSSREELPPLGAAEPVRFPYNAAWLQAVRKDAMAAAFSGAYMGVLGPFLGLVAAKTMHAPVFALSLIMAAPFVGNMLTPLWVHHIHGKPKMPFVIVPGLVARCVYLLLGLVRSASQFVAVVFIAQLFEASAGPAYSAVIERIYPQKRRGRLMSLVRIVRTIVVIAVTFAAGHVIDRWGFRQVFVAAALCGLASSIVFSTVRVPGHLDDIERQHPKATPGAAWGIFRNDNAYRRFGLSVFLYGMGNLLLNPIYPLFAANTLRITYSQQGTLAFISAIASVVGFAAAGPLNDRKGPVRCVTICIAIVAIKPILWYFARGFEWLIPTSIADGLSNAGIEIAYLNSILAFSPPERIPSYQSLHATLLGIRGVLAPFIAGALVTLLQAHHLSVRYAFLVSFVMMLISLGLCPGIRVPTKPRQTPL